MKCAECVIFCPDCPHEHYPICWNYRALAEYTDWAGLPIEQSEIDADFASSGLNKKAFEQAAIVGALTPSQARAFLAMYAQVKQWVSKQAVTD